MIIEMFYKILRRLSKLKIVFGKKLKWSLKLWIHYEPEVPKYR